MRAEKKAKTKEQPSQGKPFACIALVLQGGGALGAYQCGVYEAMAGAGVQPDWVAGISIGAINAALIAGNPPEKRIAQMRAFWDKITEGPLSAWIDMLLGKIRVGDTAHGVLDQIAAAETLIAGVPGFFKPRFPPPWLAPIGATSFYDTSALRETLVSLIDFDRINSGAMRFSVGAVNVRTGNFAYFDSTTCTIRPEHILASCALPPGFPAVEVDGEFYWDGGLVSNTPLQWVVESEPRQDILAFQIDLWSSRGALPVNLADVGVRQKEIQFSSRTRASTDQLRQMQKIRAALTKHLRNVPENLRKTPEGKLLTAFSDPKVYNIVQLIYRSNAYEGNSKDYEFSRLSMAEHWSAGREDAGRALAHPEIFKRPVGEEGFQAFDFGWSEALEDTIKQQEAAQ